MQKIALFSLMFCYVIIIKANNPGYLGVLIRDFENKEIKGVQVVNVFDSSSALQYGLKENDILVSINGKRVQKREDLTTEIANYNWGDAVQIGFVRNGQTASITAHLGRKVNSKTYNILKEIKQDGEHWLFTDDKTEVILTSDNIPISISKTDENGKVDSWKVGTNYSLKEIPQYFLDIEDKVFSIKRIKADQTKRNCTINDIQYIRETITEAKPKPTPKNEIEDIKDNFSIFPNPTNGMFNINISNSKKGTAQIVLFDITGRIVQTEIIQNFTGEFSKQFDLQKEAKGIYLIQLRINNEISSKKILLQ